MEIKHKANWRLLFGQHHRAYLSLFTLCAAEIGFAGWIRWRYYDLNPFSVLLFGNVTTNLAGWFAIPLIWVGSVSLALPVRKVARPSKVLLRLIRVKRTWLVRGIILSLIIIPLGRAFSTIKNSMDEFRPFQMDPALAHFDRLLLGTDAWRITHAFIGDLGTSIIDRIYILWAVYLIILTGWFAFTRNRAFQVRAVISMNLCWFVLGGLVATMLSSVGPCFYEQFYGDPHFAPLMDELHQTDRSHPLVALIAMEALIRAEGTTSFGGGISAMPSLHVSMVFLGVLALYNTGARWWLKAVAVVFLLFILVGSVHLGWHYAVDGIVSIAGTYLIWIVVGQFVRATDKPAKTQAPQPPPALSATARSASA